MATPPKGIPTELLGLLDKITPHIKAILSNKPNTQKLYEDTAAHPDRGEATLQRIILQSGAQVTTATLIKNEVALIESTIRNKSPAKRAPYKVVERFDTIRLKAIAIVQLNQEAKRTIFPKIARAVVAQNLDMLDSLIEVLLEKSSIEGNLALIIQQELEFLRRGE